jgi:hypothetical protein
MEDVVPQIRALEGLANRHGRLLAPTAIQDALQLALRYFSGLNDTFPVSPPPSVPAAAPARNIQQHVKLNTRTTLELLYTYDSAALVEFPETSVTGSIGHLFPMKPGAS